VFLSAAEARGHRRPCEADVASLGELRQWIHEHLVRIVFHRSAMR